MQNRTVIINTAAYYPDDSVFSPSESYPEYPWDADTINADAENRVYPAVRQTLHSLSLDAERFGTSAWNPLGELIKSGDTVLLKPNMVKESHLSKPDEYEYVITHGAVIRAVCDFVVLALQGRGKVLFADAPETDADFDLICERNGLMRLRDFYRVHAPDLVFEVIDLRREQWLKKDGVIVDRWPLQGDPGGYTEVKLNRNSEFIGHQSNGDYFGATFEKQETQRHHHGNVHEYLMSGSVLDADVLVNIPKLKTHKKSGITCCLKNMVGVNGDKNWLPHHTEGTPSMGGDQFAADNSRAKLEFSLFGWMKAQASKNPTVARILGAIKKIGRPVFGSTEEVIRSGNWYGNDTVWRMVLDLNKAVLLFDRQGELRASPRRTLCIVDAILAGEGIGPMHPDMKELGLIIGGFDPAVVDLLCANIMGFDYRKIPAVSRAFEIEHLPITKVRPDDVQVTTNIDGLGGMLENMAFDPGWRFEPHFGWKGHIEKDAPEASLEYAG